MGEIVINMHSTLDGVIQSNGGPMEDDGDFQYGGWERPFWDQESGDQSAQINTVIQACDALLLGRKTYDIFRKHWPKMTDEIGEVFNRVPKYVVSRGTPHLTWVESIQITDPSAELPALRQRHDQIHTWGSGYLIQTLMRDALFDRVNLWVYPIVLGQGQKMFPEGTQATKLRPVEPPIGYPTGAMLTRYARVDGTPETGSPGESS